MTILIKVIEQYFHVVLFNVLYKVVLTFMFVDEILAIERLQKVQKITSCQVSQCTSH